MIAQLHVLDYNSKILHGKIAINLVSSLVEDSSKVPKIFPLA